MKLVESHRQRNRLADVEKWKDFQDAVRSSAEQSLKGRPMVKKVWLQQNILELVEQKRLAFARWQEDRLDWTRRQEYNMLAKEVKRAVEDRRRHCDNVLNVSREVTGETLRGLVDNSNSLGATEEGNLATVNASSMWF